MRESRPIDVDRLHRDVQWALQHNLERRELVPMLERLERNAPGGSELSVFAKLELATALLEEQPWRSARLAKEVLDALDLEHAWGILGLAHTVLRNYRCALKAYGRALRWAPNDPSYLHNLGHLLDVVFGRPLSALRWLEAACRAAPKDPEIRASMAHALLRAGRPAAARRALRRALGERSAEVDKILQSWSRAVLVAEGPAPDAEADLTECALDG